jgi:hypothetical protein
MATSPMAESHDGYMCDFGGKILSFELEFSELLLIAFLFKAILRKINQKSH